MLLFHAVWEATNKSRYVKTSQTGGFFSYSPSFLIFFILFFLFQVAEVGVSMKGLGRLTSSSTTGGMYTVPGE